VLGGRGTLWGYADHYRAQGQHVEYAEQSIKYVIHSYLPCYEYSNLEYVHIHAICRVSQAEYVTRIRVSASQKQVNTYLTGTLQNY